VYVLKSLKDKGLYIGFTSNLKQRFKQHINGKVKSTKHRQPLKLIYYEAYLSKKDATKREYFLKRGRGRELLKELLVYSVI
jgi:putative endonuclease